MYVFSEKEGVQYRSLLEFCDLSFTAGDARTRKFMECMNQIGRNSEKSVPRPNFIYYVG
jgi:hypothetical protein